MRGRETNLDAVALGAAVEESGLAARAARSLSRGAGGSPTRLYVQLIAGIPAMALLVPSTITRNAILTLAAMGVGQATRAGRAVMLAPGLNPIVTGLALTIAVDAVILYPVQTAANLMAYESGAFNRADVMKMGLAMLALTVLVVQLSLPYWALLGLALQAP